jgi:hypothetical protein
MDYKEGQLIEVSGFGSTWEGSETQARILQTGCLPGFKKLF